MRFLDSPVMSAEQPSLQERSNTMYQRSRIFARYQGASFCGDVQLTRPSFCTTANERVYITARGCETLPGGGYGLLAAGAGGR